MPESVTDAALDQLFREARSYNGWLDREVSEEQVRQIYALAKMGPTSANQQPARFVWCRSQAAKDRLAAHASRGNKAKISTAQVCLIIGYDLDFHEQLPWLFPHTDAKSWFTGDEAKRRENAGRNSALQGAYVMLAARAIGLDCGPMSGFDKEAVTADFFADHVTQEGPRWRADWLCSIGYGDKGGILARSPRPDFETFNQIL